MPVFEGVKQALTFENVLIAIAVIILGFGLIKAIVSGVEAWKKISLRDRVKALETKMEAVETRLDAGTEDSAISQRIWGRFFRRYPRCRSISSPGTTTTSCGKATSSW